MIFGKDPEHSPNGSEWKRNQWMLQIRCPTRKPLCTRGLARNGLIRLMRNSDLWLKTQPGTMLGWKTFQPASRPLAPSRSSRPRSYQEAAFGRRPGLLSVVLNSRWASGKKMCIRTHRLHPDAPGARDAPDAPWQRTYRSQRKTHRQCEFGRCSPRHHVSGNSSSRHLFTGQSVAGHFRSRRTVSGHFASERMVSGNFPSGHSHVRAFSFWTQPC